MKIMRIELGKLCQFTEVVDEKPAELHLDQSELAQQLERPVHVYARQSERLAQILLRDGQIATAVVDETRCVGPHIGFAEQVGHRRVCRLSAVSH